MAQSYPNSIDKKNSTKKEKTQQPYGVGVIRANRTHRDRG